MTIQRTGHPGASKPLPPLPAAPQAAAAAPAPAAPATPAEALRLGELARAVAAAPAPTSLADAEAAFDALDVEETPAVAPVRGGHGPEVQALQAALMRAGYDPGALDGTFGGRTEDAVRALQQVAGIDPATGVYDAATAQALAQAPAARPAEGPLRRSAPVRPAHLAAAASAAAYDAVTRRARPIDSKTDWEARTTSAQHYDTPASKQNWPADRQAEAQKQYLAFRAAEVEAFKQLSPAEQQAYNALAATLERNPIASRAMQTMLLEGRTAGFAELAALATSTEPLAPGLDREDLVAELTQEIANPGCIFQSNTNDCAAASAQIMLATKQPADYVRIAAGLASAAGVAGPFRRDAGSEQDDKRYRSSSSRLMQAAFMEYAKDDVGYSDKTGKGQKHPEQDGLWWDDQGRLLGALFGGEYKEKRTTHANPPRHAKPQAVMADIAAELAAGRPVAASLLMKNGGDVNAHAIVVTAMDADQVTILNPWGREETISRQDFEARLKGATLPTGR